MLCVRYLPLTALVLIVSGQGDHRRRPADRDEDDASFKVQYNTTYYALYSENDVRYYVSLNAWRKNRVLDRFNLSASVPANMVNPLFMQPADDVAPTLAADWWCCPAAQLPLRPSTVPPRRGRSRPGSGGLEPCPL
jgi:hypothetical protein